MSDTNWGQVLKVIGGIAVAVVVLRACSSKEGRYNPPDPMDYNSMKEFKRDKIEYDKNYEQDRRDYQAEHATDPL